MISCSPRLTPGRVLPEYYNAGEKGKIAEGKFDLKKLKEEQKRNTLLPAQKVNQESFKTKVPLSYHEHSPEAGCAPPCCGHETHLLQRRGALPGTPPARRSQRLPPRRLHPGQQKRLPDGVPAPPQGHGPLRGCRGPLPPGPYIYSNPATSASSWKSQGTPCASSLRIPAKNSWRNSPTRPTNSTSTPGLKKVGKRPSYRTMTPTATRH